MDGSFTCLIRQTFCMMNGRNAMMFFKKISASLAVTGDVTPAR